MITIKDMEMPKKCYECRFAALQSDGMYYCAAQKPKWPITFIEERAAKNSQPFWCPLVEVKDIL